MDRFELVEKLVKSTGVSYEDAKTALESSEWDLLDAAVWLEKNGRIETKTSHFSTNPEQQQEQEEKRQKQEEQQRREAPRGSAGSQSSVRLTLNMVFSKIRGILMENELVLCKQSGEIFMEIPIWLAIILLCVAFWPTIIVLLIVFIFLGFRFRFHGPDLGSDKVNRVLNNIEDWFGTQIDRLKNQKNSAPNYKNYDSSAKTTNSSDDVIEYHEPHREE